MPSAKRRARDIHVCVKLLIFVAFVACGTRTDEAIPRPMEASAPSPLQQTCRTASAEWCALAYGCATGDALAQLELMWGADQGVCAMKLSASCATDCPTGQKYDPTYAAKCITDTKNLTCKFGMDPTFAQSCKSICR